MAQQETKRVQIQKGTMILHLSFSKPGIERKIDSADVELEADNSMFHVTKDIMDSKELKAVQSFDNQTTNLIRKRPTTFPFFRGMHGFYTILITDLASVNALLRDREAIRSGLIEKFIKAIPRLKEEAKRRLGKHYDESDYYTEEQYRELFRMRWTPVELDVPARLEDIDPEEYKAKSAEMNEQYNLLWDDIRLLMRVGLQGMLDKFSGILKGEKDGKPLTFKNVTFDRIIEFVDNFGSRNITSDKDLAAIVGEVKELLEQFEPDELRYYSTDNDEARGAVRELRKAVAEGLDEITETLSGMVGPKPVRAIRLRKKVKAKK